MPLVRRISNLFTRSRVERDIDAELQAHLAMRAEDGSAVGLTPEAAPRDALIRFGNPSVIKENATAVDAILILDNIWQDLRYGIRGLVKSPGFTITAMLTLGLGIGMNASLYSLASGILRPLPIREPGRVGVIVGTNSSYDDDRSPVSAPEFLYLQEQMQSFSEIAAGDASRSFNVSENGEPERLRAFQVSPNYFQLLGVTAQVGRILLPGDDHSDQRHIVVLSQSIWQRRFGMDPGIIGKTMRLDGEKYTVVGVMPGYFKQTYYPVDLWTPLVFGADQRTPRADAPRQYVVFARLKPGVATTQARAEVQSLDARYSASLLKHSTGWRASVTPIEDYFAPRPMRIALTLLMSVAGVVLLIVCGNVSGLLLARGLAREREFAIRRALGASRWRIARQLMLENLILSLLGGGFALLLALGGVRLLRARLDFNAYGAFIADKIALDGGVLVFTLAISVCAALLFGLLPALDRSKIQSSSPLREAARHASSGKRPSRLRGVLVVGQIAAALVLLTCCTFVIKGLYDLDNLNQGFDPKQVITAGLQLSQETYDSADKQRAFVAEAVRRVQRLPGVQLAAATTDLPISLARMVPFSLEGQPITKPEDRPWARYYAISPEYLHVMHIQLAGGRGFSASDDAGKPAVALVNQAFLRQFAANGDVLGKHVTVAFTSSTGQTVAEIVGVVANVADYQGQSSFQPQIYLSLAQYPDARLALVARTSLNPKSLIVPLRQAVRSLDRNQAIDNPRTMTQVVTTTNGGNRLIVFLLEIFAVLSLLLVAIGIYGVIAFTVNQRNREIGVRMALGAHRRQILFMVLNNGIKLAVIGLLVGLPLCLPLPHLLGHIFQNVVRFQTYTIAVLIGVPLFVVLVALVSTYVPALRASRIDPAGAIRYE
jgi:putative ABC transport system permease protein